MKKKANKLYREILANTKDRGLRGKTYANLASMNVGKVDFDSLNGPKNLFRAAIKEGYLPAYAQCAVAYERLGRTAEAKNVAKTGLASGDGNSAIMLIRLMPEVIEEPDSRSLWELIKASFKGDDAADKQSEINRQEREWIIKMLKEHGINLERAGKEFYASIKTKENQNMLSRFIERLPAEEVGMCGVTLDE